MVLPVVKKLRAGRFRWKRVAWVRFSEHLESVTSGTSLATSETGWFWICGVGDMSLQAAGLLECAGATRLLMFLRWAPADGLLLRYPGGWWKQSGVCSAPWLPLAPAGCRRLTLDVSLDAYLGTLRFSGAAVLGIVGWLSEAGRNGYFCSWKCSSRMLHLFTLPEQGPLPGLSMHKRRAGVQVAITSRRMPTQEVPNPNWLLGSVGITLCPLQPSSPSFWLALIWNSGETV